MTVEEGLLGRPVGLVNEGLQSQPVGNNRSRERPTHARQQAGAQAGARARASAGFVPRGWRRESDLPGAGK